MIVSRPALLLSAQPSDTEAVLAAATRSGLVVPFAPAARPRRLRPEAGETRGEILLFLGVRYERRAS